MADWMERMRAPMRDLRIGGRIVFGSGMECALDGDRVLALSIEEGADGALVPGSVLCAACTLDLANADGEWEAGGSCLGANELTGATLMPMLGAARGDDIIWRSLGVFQVEQALSMPGEGRMRLSASDSIGFELAEPFADGMTYPRTLAQLWNHAVSQTRYAWSGEIPNGGAVVDSAPDWKDASLRAVLGCIAAAAGCFVRVDRGGSLELCPLKSSEAPVEIGADDCLKLEYSGAIYGPVDALKLSCAGGEAERTYTAEDGAGLCTLRVSENPLFMEGAPGLDGMAWGLLNAVAGFTTRGMNFEWRGDPLLRIGDPVCLRDAAGAARSGVLTRQTLRFSGGFSAACACAAPEDETSGLRRAITPEGGLNAAALTGAVDGALLRVGSVTTGKLAAGSITAEKLASGAVDAGALKAVTAKIGALTAADIETDALAAALAAFTVLTAGTASFDRATVQHLVAQALNLEFGAAGQAFIRNLAVEYAQLAGAAIGNLCIKASDGNYYAIDVNPDGSVNASLTSVSEGEITAGETGAGRVILETAITAADLNAGNLLATYALLNRIDAARIDVDQLFAREAFVALLRTAKIVGDRSITMIAGQAAAALEGNVYDGDVPPEAPEEGKLWLDRGVSPPLLRRWTGADVPADRSFVLEAQGNPLLCAGRVRGFDSILVRFGPVQAGEGDPAPGNVRPIAPRTDLSLSLEGGGNSASFSVDFGRELYGGSYEWLSGALVSDRICVGLAGRVISPVGVTKAGVPYARVLLPRAVAGEARAACSHYCMVAAGTDYKSGMARLLDSYVFIYDDRFVDAAAAEAVLAAENPQLAYEVEPEEIQLAPRAILPFEGENSLRSDGDSILLGYSGTGWEPVNDTSALERKLDTAVQQDALQHMIRVAEDGLHVGAPGSTGEIRIDHDSVDVQLNGQRFSSFSGNYVEFGNYQLRRTADGGLAFKMR